MLVFFLFQFVKERTKLMHCSKCVIFYPILNHHISRDPSIFLMSHKIRFLIPFFPTKNHKLNFAQREFDFESTSALLIQHLSPGGRRGLASRKSRVVFHQKDFRLIILSFFFQSLHLQYRQSTYLKEGVEKKQSSVCRRALSVDLVDLWILQSPLPVRMWLSTSSSSPLQSLSSSSAQ